MILMGHFQLEIFYDSKFHRYILKKRCRNSSQKSYFQTTLAIKMQICSIKKC